MYFLQLERLGWTFSTLTPVSRRAMIQTKVMAVGHGCQKGVPTSLSGALKFDMKMNFKKIE
jgi:hypothetical protein